MAVAPIQEKTWRETLVAPREWCDAQWGRVFSPIDPEECAFFEAVVRAGKVFLLIIPTIIAYAIAGGVWVFEPASSSQPLDLEKAPRVADPFPRALRREEAVILSKRECSILENPNLVGKITSFLEPGERRELMCTAPIFYFSLISSDGNEAWENQVTELRLKGIDFEWRKSCRLQHNRHDLERALQPSSSQQLQQFSRLKKQYPPEYIEYLARLIEGGPVRLLLQVPRFARNVNLSQVESHHVIAPLMYAKRGKEYLLALRFKINGAEEFSTLIFYWPAPQRNEAYTRALVKGNLGLFPDLNSSFPEGQMNYFLRLINGEPLGQVPNGWPTVIKLA